ncbi:MAG: phosphatase PAP2 family protein [Spirochaetaceae bacterium]|nr:phosphatase PAP2 family protein [Spirochaetaceae bacterium]
MIFHDIGRNTLGSITYNYGLDFIAAGAGTWAFIETGLDWKWRVIAYNNLWLSGSGIPALYIGYVVPGIAPLAVYLSGRFARDEKLQITGMALTQTLFLTLGIPAILKISSGRALPGIITRLDHTRSSRTDDFSGEFAPFNMNFIGGWPSSHTANAFSAAAVIAEIYHDNPAVKIGAYTYAALIGLGVSVSVHWASDVFAGALIGYAIGKTVGKSYRKLREHRVKNNSLTFYASYHSVGISIKR